MKSILFNFDGVKFKVDEIENGLFDLNDLRKQVVAVKTENTQFKAFRSTQSMSDWVKWNLDDSLKDKYQLKSTRGRGAKTVANKIGLFAYASWLNEDFQLALLKAFEAISEGRDNDARKIVGDSVIDLEFAKKVEERWKAYVKWCYEKFAPVNKNYAGNMTRCLVKGATGHSTKNNILGKVDSGLIQRCVDQGNGAAILAINSHLDIIRKTMKSGLLNEWMRDREGLKKVYAYFKDMFDWDENN